MGVLDLSAGLMTMGAPSPRKRAMTRPTLSTDSQGRALGLGVTAKCPRG